MCGMYYSWTAIELDPVANFKEILVSLKQKVIILELGSCAIRAGILGESGESLLRWGFKS